MCQNIHTGDTKCGTKTDAKGKLIADVVTYKAGTKKSNEPAEGQAGLSAVKVGVEFVNNEPAVDKGDQTTGEDGNTAVVSGLDPGEYKCTLKPTKEQKHDYDFDNSETTKTKPVEADAEKTTIFDFAIPYHWLEHQVMYPDETTFASGLDFVLQLKKPGAETSFEPYPDGDGSGKTPTKTAELSKIPIGQYRLEVKAVYKAAWGADEAVIDKPIDLKAGVSGFASGTQGSFEIYDAHALTAKLATVEASVTEGDSGVCSVEKSWTPTKENLSTLKSGRIVFRAVAGSSSAWSPTVPVKIKDKYEVVDQDGKKIDAQLELRLCSGETIQKTADKGEAEIVRTWNDCVTRVRISDHSGKRVSFEDDGAAARAFSIRG